MFLIGIIPIAFAQTDSGYIGLREPSSQTELSNLELSTESFVYTIGDTVYIKITNIGETKAILNYGIFSDNLTTDDCLNYVNSNTNYDFPVFIYPNESYVIVVDSSSCLNSHEETYTLKIRHTSNGKLIDLSKAIHFKFITQQNWDELKRQEQFDSIKRSITIDGSKKRLVYSDHFGVIFFPYQLENGIIQNVEYRRGQIIDIQIKTTEDALLSIMFPQKFIDALLNHNPENSQFSWSVISKGLDLVDPIKTEIVNSTHILKLKTLKDKSIKYQIFGGYMKGGFPFGAGPPNILSHEYDYLFSIKTQLDKGVKNTDIVCKDKLNLIIKLNDEKPVCVKPSTVEILVERNWAKLI